MMLIHQREIHHIDGKTKKASEDYPGCHMLTIPLCYEHHREGANNDLYVSRHPFKAEFEKRYGTEMELLEKIKELV